MLNCETKPTTFDKKQLAKCRKCKHASANVSFCGRPAWGGFYIVDPANEKYPSIITQAKSFGKAAVKQVAAGMPTRSAEKIAEAMRICKQCPKYVAEDERCKKCGCRMPAKIKWATTNCPLKKW